MSIRLIAFSRLVVVMGLAMWLTIAVFNNVTDSGTNRQLLGHTLSMGLLEQEEVLGAGLRWRAMPAELASVLLYLVIAAQLLVCASLWRASVTYMRVLLKNDDTSMSEARNRALLALSLFVLLWMWFICGGLWFGYWLKQGAVQMVHLSLIVIGLCALTFVQNQPVFRLPGSSNLTEPSPDVDVSPVLTRSPLGSLDSSSRAGRAIQDATLNRRQLETHHMHADSATVH